MFGGLVDIDQQTKDFSILTEATNKVRNTWVQNVIHLELENRWLYLQIYPLFNHSNITPNSRPQTQFSSGKTLRINNSPGKCKTKAATPGHIYKVRIGWSPTLLQATFLFEGKRGKKWGPATESHKADHFIDTRSNSTFIEEDHRPLNEKSRKRWITQRRKTSTRLKDR